MRARWLLSAGLLLPVATFGQNPPIQDDPLSPLQRQQLLQAPPVQAPPVQAAPVQAVPALPQPVPPVPSWVAAGTARLQALDKVNSQATVLTVKVGQSAIFGSLTIAVKSCMVRPPDQAPDAAAFLTVTDSHSDSAGFSGWMLANEPSVSMMQDPIYDIRLTGCA